MNGTWTDKRWLILLLAGVAAPLAVLAALVSGSYSGTARTIEVASVHVSWADSYHSLADLKKNSDVVVAGVFTQIAATTQDSAGIVYTDFDFSIGEVIWDPQQRIKGSSIVIHQTGGTLDNKRFEVGDDPLYQINEEAILFLHEYEPGHFYSLGGPAGRFPIDKGQVRTVGENGPKLDRSLTRGEFVDLIKATSIIK